MNIQNAAIRPLFLYSLLAGATVLAGTTVLVNNAAAAAETADTGSGVIPLAFSDGNLDGWSERSFEGNTEYRLVDDNGVAVLMGKTDKQASIFYREESVNLGSTPIVNWTWKIDGTFQNISEKSRDGDDFPARLYVVAKTGVLPWQTLAINYVWASQLPVGETWPNPFTDKAQMVVVQSGDTDAGKWTEHSRNVAEDFRTLFGRDIGEIRGYAVMVDGDNSGQQATAWFGNIRFSEATGTQ